MVRFNLNKKKDKSQNEHKNKFYTKNSKKLTINQNLNKTKLKKNKKIIKKDFYIIFKKKPIINFFYRIKKLYFLSLISITFSIFIASITVTVISFPSSKAALILSVNLLSLSVSSGHFKSCLVLPFKSIKVK